MTKSLRKIENPVAVIICVVLLVSLVVSTLVLSRVLPDAAPTTTAKQGRILHPLAESNLCRAIFFDINTGARKGEEIVPCGVTPRKLEEESVTDRFGAMRDSFTKR